MTTARAVLLSAALAGAAQGCGPAAEPRQPEATTAKPAERGPSRDREAGCPEVCCASGSESCALEAERLLAIPLDTTPARYLEVHEAGCDRGEIESCTSLSQLLLFAPAYPRDPARALALEQKACRGGHGVACWDLALKSASGAGDTDSPTLAARAVELLVASCERGDGSSCDVAGTLVRSGAASTIPPERSDAFFARASALFDRECAAGSARACRKGALLAAGGRGSADVSRALDLFTKACELGSALGCGRRGMAIFRGAVPGAGSDEGAALLTRACEGQNADACFALGDLQRAGRIGPAGEAAARRSFARASSISRAQCDLGLSSACRDIVGYLELGVQEPQSVPSTLEYLAGVCDRGEFYLCHELSLYFSRGPSKDDARALRFRELACKHGHPACPGGGGPREPAAP